MQPQLLLLLFLAAVVSSATPSTKTSEYLLFLLKDSEDAVILQTLVCWTVRLDHAKDYSDVTFSTRKLVSVNNSSMEDVEEMQITSSPSGAVKKNVNVRHKHTQWCSVQ